MPGTLAPDDVVPVLRGRFGQPFVYEPVCASTQRLLGERLPEGAVAACEEQTEGRGRLGRTWEAPAGEALLCSLLLRPPPGRAIPELALVGGLGAALTVEDALGRRAGIKWPNDVLVDGRKVAGVLAEATGTAVVLGVGINVNQEAGALPVEARTPAVSLAALDGRTRDRAALLASLLAHLESCYDQWLASGLEGLLVPIGERDALLGQPVEAGGRCGVGAGIEVDGRLAIDTRDGRVLVASGEVTALAP